MQVTAHIGPVELAELLRGFCAAKNLTYVEHGVTAEGIIELVAELGEVSERLPPVPQVAAVAVTQVPPASKPKAPKLSLGAIMSPELDPVLHGHAPEAHTLAGPTPGPLDPDDELAALARGESTEF